MKAQLIAAVTVLALAPLLVSPAHSQGQAPGTSGGVLDTADAVLDCAAANAPRRGFKQTATLTTTDADGNARTQRALMFGRFEPVDAAAAAGQLALTLQITDPIDVSGSSVLIRRAIGDGAGRDEQHVYLPTLRKSRRIVGSMADTPMLGTDLTYADVARMFGAITGSDAKLVPGAPDGVYRVHVIPHLEAGATAQPMIADIDAEHCVPLLLEFMSDSGEPSKRISIEKDSVVVIGERRLPQRAQVVDLANDTRTDVVLENIEIDPTLRDAFFHPRSYHRAR